MTGNWELDREIEDQVWEIGPEKFARKGHARCVNFGSRESSGVAYIYMGDSITGSGTFANNAMVLCSCVVRQVQKHGLRIITRRPVR